MKVTKLTEALGARVEGIDLSKPVDNSTLEEIKALWREHLVLVFPNQELTNAQQMDFSLNFGEIMEHPQTEGTPAKEGIRAEHPALLPVTEDANTSGWHADITGMEIPPSLAFLYGKEPILQEGVDEDTHFCNQYRTFENLSPGLQEFLKPRNAIHSMKSYLRGNAKLVRGKNLGLTEEAEDDFLAGQRAKVFQIPPEQTHPCVRLHPETGRLSIYCDTASTKSFEGWTRKESLPLLEKIVETATRPDNVYRHKWAKGDLVCWDNRCTMHKGPDNKLFPPDVKRFLVRVTVIPREEMRPFGLQGPGYVTGEDPAFAPPMTPSSTIASRL